MWQTLRHQTLENCKDYPRGQLSVYLVMYW